MAPATMGVREGAMKAIAGSTSRRSMFVERDSIFTQLFSIFLVGWHVSAVSLPPVANVIKLFTDVITSLSA